ncbi:MAG: TRAP transporter large permease [Desulfovibrio sp.]|uniref:TRAP transporter large permease n=1 Tax=Desulfovibrio sp. TaxID=885 RepID=UPI001A64F26C|nr:TRAP transporter large permease [Desulfovibrio sp.]MBD5417399.1 TRAP transporter large permease [Desulfovibrio sp.]
MDPVIVTAIVSLVLVFLSVPLGVSIGFGVLAGLWAGDMPFILFTQRLFNTFDSFPIMAIPFFLLSAEIMSQGTLADKLLNFCRAMCGHIRGGLAHISIITSLFYGALCGSAAAAVAAVGGMMIPAMEKDHYPPAFSTALNCASGCLANIIPPSIAFILYGSFGGVSVSDMFIAGVIPGIVVALSLMVAAAIIIARKGYGRLLPRATAREKWEAARRALPSLGVPVIVLGGIYGGLVTPTEAGVLAVFYSLLVEGLSGSLNRTVCRRVLVKTLNTLGMFFLILVMANALGTFMLYLNIQESIITAMRDMTTNPYIFMLIMIAFLLFIGTFLEATAIILILSPLLVPLVVSYGINPVHFGIVMICCTCIGLLTPPMGTNLFVGSSITGLSVITLSRAILPFVGAMILAALLIAYVPWFSLALL